MPFPGRNRSMIQATEPVMRKAMEIFDASGRGTEELAARVGLRPNTICDWRADRATARLPNFVAFVNALGYDVRLVKRE